MSSTLAGLSTFPMIANLRRPGTVSRRIWRRLVARSVPWLDTPVMFEPGRARLATRPVATGSPYAPHPLALLRPRRERPRGRRGAEQRDELTALHVEHGGLPPLCAISPPTGPCSVFRTCSLPQGGL